MDFLRRYSALIMIVTQLQQDDESEPLWDSVGIRSCDFRPHFEGKMHNVFTTIFPLESRSDTEAKFKDAALTIVDWILKNKSRFSSGDRFQVIVGWPLEVRRTDRQCIKTGGDFIDLDNLLKDSAQISMREGWHFSIFDSEATEK